MYQLNYEVTKKNIEMCVTLKAVTHTVDYA